MFIISVPFGHLIYFNVKQLTQQIRYNVKYIAIVEYKNLVNLYMILEQNRDSYCCVETTAL